MTGDRPAPERCPRCAAATAGGGVTVVWCPACDWNVDPHPPPPPTGRRARLAASVSARLVAGLFDEVRREGVGRRRTDPAGWVALILALGVHLLTLGVLALGTAALVTIRPMWLAVGFAVAPLGVGFLLLPRPDALPRGTHLLTADQAPALHALVRRVAAAAGAPPPHLVGIDARYNASVSRVGWRQRRLLVLGLPLWDCLEGQARVALLGHELGHEINADPRRGSLVGSALEALTEWYRLTDQGFHVDETLGVFMPSGGGLVGLGAMITRWVMAVVALIPRWAHFCLLAVTLRSSQRAEYFADAVGARVAGPAGVVALQEHTVMSESYRLGVRRAALNGRYDVMSAGRDQLRSLPAEEFQRTLRRAALRPRRAFESHPPPDLRYAFARSLPAASPAVVLDDGWADRIAGELEPVSRSVSATLRDEVLGFAYRAGSTRGRSSSLDLPGSRAVDATAARLATADAGGRRGD